MQETWVRFLGWGDPLEKKKATHSVFLPGKSHGQRSLVDYIVYGVAKESDRTERLKQQQQQHTHIHIYTTHFFIHLSVDRYLGCIHILAIVNTAAVNTGVHGVFLNYGFCVTLAQAWECQILGLALSTVFFRHSETVVQWLLPRYIPLTV